jgi:3-oxoadipate enol-lactonase
VNSGADSSARPHAPVLLLTGGGLTGAVAFRVADKLRSQFEVLIGDGFAVTTAEHALALLDDAGVEEAHVVGFSFGGAVAQHLAIVHPHRVRSLVLCSSSPGGRLYVPPERAIRHFIGRLRSLPIEEGLWAAVPYLYAPATLRRYAPRIGQDIARRLGAPLDPRGYSRQRAAARSHDAASGLGAITAPTLVVHGEQDRILPLENGQALADRIAGSRFLALANAGHAFPTDVPAASRKLVSFLVAQSSRQARRTARSGRGARA